MIALSIAVEQRAYRSASVEVKGRVLHMPLRGRVGGRMNPSCCVVEEKYSGR